MVFPTLIDSMFAENHSLMLINSSLTVLNNVFMLLSSKNKFVSSANIIGASKFEELGDRLHATKIIVAVVLTLAAPHTRCIFSLYQYIQ